VLFVRSNGNNVSEARFYIDGNLQIQEFATALTLNTLNEFPLYIGSNPNAISSFVGELKEFRF